MGLLEILDGGFRPGKNPLLSLGELPNELAFGIRDVVWVVSLAILGRNVCVYGVCVGVKFLQTFISNNVLAKTII